MTTVLKTPKAIKRRLSSLLESSPEREGGYRIVPQCVCADGFKLSVQASAAHYCSPRDNYGPYYKVEVGFPSEVVLEFLPHIDGGPNENPTETVYGYVPLETVVEVIARHGGLRTSA